MAKKKDVSPKDVRIKLAAPVAESLSRLASAKRRTVSRQGAIILENVLYALDKKQSAAIQFSEPTENH